MANYNCIEHLKAWWAETEDTAQTQPNLTIKMMLTGNGNAGKSTLFYALKDGKCEMELDSTHGVLLETWACAGAPIVEFVIWDFGGQEIYHGSHRLFMASDAIQLALFDPVTEKRPRKIYQLMTVLRVKKHRSSHCFLDRYYPTAQPRQHYHGSTK
ncbi:MAG: hypothetical protein IPM82_29505 [Saprospiraceae bacterium]|nr:hypothetical protein [Saprospiraceae bacterium]